MEMKYTITLRKEVENGFIDPLQVTDYENFDDVRESGSPEAFATKVKGQIRFREVMLKLAGLTSWDEASQEQENGTATTAPESVKIVLFRNDEFEEKPISEDEIKDAIAFALTHSYKAPMDVWHPQTKTESSGKVLMPLGFMTEIVEAEALYENADDAKAIIEVVIE